MAEPVPRSPPIQFPWWAPIRNNDQESVFLKLDREYAFLLDELSALERQERELGLEPDPAHARFHEHRM